MSVTRWATFDCYGTLIDWDGGIGRELGRLFPEVDTHQLLARYHDFEPEVQRADPARSYRDVMRLTLERVAEAVGRAIPPREADALGRSLPAWEPFPDVPSALRGARARGWKLAILSNTDPDFIEASKQRIGIQFDETVVASDIGSYKPAHAHWQEFFARTRADAARHVHIAASVFHDIAPARELGLRSIWVNRAAGSSSHTPTRELPDLSRLPETLDELVSR
jgi:2-haloacid dehalogenase